MVIKFIHTSVAGTTVFCCWKYMCVANCTHKLIFISIKPFIFGFANTLCPYCWIWWIRNRCKEPEPHNDNRYNSKKCWKYSYRYFRKTKTRHINNVVAWKIKNEDNNCKQLKRMRWKLKSILSNATFSFQNNSWTCKN